MVSGEPDPIQLEVAAAVRRELSGTGDPWAALVRLGVPGYEIPPEAGGLGLGLTTGLVVAEELGRARTGPVLEAQQAVADALLAAGGSDPRLPGLAAGTLRVAELRPRGDDAGPPSAAGEFVTVEGRSGGAADLLLVGDVLVDPGRPVAAGETVRLVRHPVADRLAGLRPERARLRQAAYLVGLAAAAFEAAVTRAHERSMAGRPLIDHQDVGFRLARAQIELVSTRLLVHRAAQLLEEGVGGPGPAVEALATAAELALDVTREAVHLSGAHGLTEQSPARAYYEHAAPAAVRLGAPRQLWREAARHRATTAGSGADLTVVAC